MKLSRLKQIREEVETTLNQKWQVIFDTFGEDELVKQIFNSKQEAQDWVNDKEWEDDTEAFVDGEPQYVTKTYYYNPETKESYNTGYEINPVENLSESQSKQQEMYVLADQMTKEIKDLGIFLRKKGYNV